MNPMRWVVVATIPLSFIALLAGEWIWHYPTLGPLVALVGLFAAAADGVRVIRLVRSGRG